MTHYMAHHVKLDELYRLPNVLAHHMAIHNTTSGFPR